MGLLKDRLNYDIYAEDSKVISQSSQYLLINQARLKFSNLSRIREFHLFSEDITEAGYMRIYKELVDVNKLDRYQEECLACHPKCAKCQDYPDQCVISCQGSNRKSISENCECLDGYYEQNPPI